MRHLLFYLTIFCLILTIVIGKDVQESQNNPTPKSSSESLELPSKSPNAIQACIDEKKCLYTDLDCRAKCAGVPNPTKTHIDITNDCIKQCLPKNATSNSVTNQEYEDCSRKCIKENFIINTQTTSTPPITKTSSNTSIKSTIVMTPIPTGTFIEKDKKGTGMPNSNDHVGAAEEIVVSFLLLYIGILTALLALGW
ncbi:hypothetical protein G9A89_009365 [Geosiphon pyriformis]|nr:hypothetical protein G9A89_009365 [Geosiphon pyriformis]